MPLKPFPIPLSLGTDICRIPRIYSILCSRTSTDYPSNFAFNRHPSPPERFVRKILISREIAENRDRVQAALRWGELGRKRAMLWRKGRELGVTEQMVEGRRGTEHRRGLEGLSRGGRWGRIKITRGQNEERGLKAEEKPDLETTEKLQDEGQELMVKVDHLDLMLSLIEEIELEEAGLKSEVRRSAEFLAGRFAAKEAAIKAHCSRRLTYQDICIVRSSVVANSSNTSSAPVAHIKPERGDWEDAQVVPINISHDGHYATAVCMSYEPSYLSPQVQAHDPPHTLVRRGPGRHVLRPLHSLDRPYSHAIFIRNIPQEITDKDLLGIFGKDGEVSGHICRDEQGRGLGYGWVVYESEKDAVDACKKQVWLQKGDRGLRAVWGGKKFIWEVVSRTVEEMAVGREAETGEEGMVKVRLYSVGQVRKKK